MATSLLDTLAGTAERTVVITPLRQTDPPPVTPAPEIHGVRVVPYDARLDTQADAFLSWMWHRMQEDDLVDYYFPGQKDTGYATFVRLMSGDAQVALFVTESDSKQWEDRIAGFITWSMSRMGASDVIIAGFIFFRKFWDHKTTDESAIIAFEHWFRQSNANVVLGVCPSLHMSAMRYNKRIGLREIGRIPLAHIYKGEKCDAILMAITRDEWVTKGRT